MLRLACPRGVTLDRVRGNVEEIAKSFKGDGPRHSHTSLGHEHIGQCVNDTLGLIAHTVPERESNKALACPSRRFHRSNSMAEASAGGTVVQGHIVEDRLNTFDPELLDHAASCRQG